MKRFFVCELQRAEMNLHNEHCHKNLNKKGNGKNFFVLRLVLHHRTVNSFTNRKNEFGLTPLSFFAYRLSPYPLASHVKRRKRLLSTVAILRTPKTHLFCLF